MFHSQIFIRSVLNVCELYFLLAKTFFPHLKKTKQKSTKFIWKEEFYQMKRLKIGFIFWKQGLSLWNTAASKLRGGGACNRWSYLIWSTKPVQCWWHSLLGATQQTGNLRDMGGRLIRWWRGERTDTQSDWFTVWISASADVQSWTPEF